MIVSPAKQRRTALREATARFVVVAVLLMAACDLSPPPALDAQRVAVSVAKSSLLQGDSTTATATPYDTRGRKLSTSTLVWRSNPAGAFSIRSSNQGHAATVIASQPGAGYLVASWPRSDKRTISDSVSVTVTTPPKVDPSQGALYYEDFSKFTSTSDLQKRFWIGPGKNIVGYGPGISYDTLEHALRYDWPARPSSACMNDELTIALMPRFTPPAGVKNLWIRFTSKESPNFEHGASHCLNVAGLAYKFFLVTLESGNTNARVGSYLINASSTSAIPTFLSTDMTDRLHPKLGGGFSLGSSWGGSYHTWVLELVGIGADTATFSVYKDGMRMPGSLAAPFLPGMSIGGSWAITLEMGANINNGPDHSQSRWFRDVGVYLSKPDLSPMVTP